MGQVNPQRVGQGDAPVPSTGAAILELAGTHLQLKPVAAGSGGGSCVTSCGAAGQLRDAPVRLLGLRRRVRR